MEEKTTRISFGLGLGLMLGAGLVDLVGLIPVTEDFTIWIFWGVVSFILSKKGVSMFDGKKLATMSVDIVIGLVPVFQALPEVTLGMAAVLAMIYAEDKSGIKIPGIEAKGKDKIPLNQGDTRPPNNDEIEELENAS
ncbi:MAG: hypothetical protein RL641_609 [Candidatus Parcubacteria bacterium]|jgi:hypothetical protein